MSLQVTRKGSRSALENPAVGSSMAPVMEQTPAAASAPAAPRDRRLAAVVFTDVVGYSAMVHADEAAALTRVDADLARMQAACAAHGGECLNTMGDGLMLAFPSAVEALSFAIEMQEEFAQRNEAAGESAGMQHRIGIHLGDVFRAADGSLAGDGVNIAARLEGNAPPGGTCISQTVHDIVKGKLAFDATFAGSRAFKNIAEPIPVWHLHPREKTSAPARPDAPPPRARIGRRAVMAASGAGAVALAVGAGAWLWRRGSEPSAAPLFDPKSIAVLPFQNMSDDKGTTYFADGMHEDLLTQLALMGQLKVVSRTSVMEYRNTVKKVPQIGSELKVASLVEGSVRRAGDVVRVTAQLLDAQTDKHVWAANYDRDIKDIFKVQSELATEIARSLNVSLNAADAQRLAKPPTANLQAYDLFLRHQALVHSVAGTLRSISSVQARIDLLKRVVALDPDFALAWAKLAAEHGRAKGYGFDIEGDQKGLAQRAMARALTLAPDDLQVKIEEGAVYLHALDDQAGAKRAYGQVLAKAPYNVDALHGLAEVLNETNDTAEAVQVLERALAVDSRNAAVLTRLAGTYGRFRHYDRALALRKQVVDMRPDDLDVRAGYEFWKFYKTGHWDSFDAWRANLPQDIEKKVARIRNLSADRAIERGDFAEVHRLIDLDSDDFKQSLSRSAEIDVELRALHVLAWNASGDPRAAAEAAETIRRIDKAIKGNNDDAGLWETTSYMRAVIGQREQALAAFDKFIALSEPGGNQYLNGVRRRRRAWVVALLGDLSKAIAEVKRQAALPGFFIHEVRLALQLAPLWKHPDFTALVADSQTNAPLRLDTAYSDGSRR